MTTVPSFMPSYSRSSGPVAAILVVFLLGTLTLLAQQPAPTVPSLPPALDGLPTSASGPLLFFLGTLVTTLVNLYIKSRDRKWDIEERHRQRVWDAEDRARIAAELRQKTEDEAAIVKRRTEEIERQMFLQHQAIADQIAANTKVSVDAFREANNVNEKIASISTMFDATQPGGRRVVDTLRPVQLQVLEAVRAALHHEDEKGSHGHD